MIRGGHVDIAILGALEVSETGDLANWTVPGSWSRAWAGPWTSSRAPADRGAHGPRGPRRVAKLRHECGLPLTGQGVVDRIITDRAVFDVLPIDVSEPARSRDHAGSDIPAGERRLVLRAVAPGVTLDDVRDATEASYAVGLDALPGPPSVQRTWRSHDRHRGVRPHPFVRFNGAFAAVPAATLGAHALGAALADARIRPDDVEVVLAGQVLQGGAARTLLGRPPSGRRALHGAAMTLNAVCLSGMEAVVQAHRLITAGEAQVVVAIGQESMSLARTPGSGHGPARSSGTRRSSTRSRTTGCATRSSRTRWA
ncbi:hypothetical protein NKG05_14520 [Oerskovia sp. M15]